jgi:BMFP domain-containing protein YqiC
MVDPRLLDELDRAVRAVLPEGLAEDIKKNLRAATSAVLARLELVTREEWEVQQALLARTREKLERLERQVAELEARLSKKTAKPPMDAD